MIKINFPHLTLAKLLYPLCQFQAVKNPDFLPLELHTTHLAHQFGRKMDQVLHEEPHSASGCRRDLGQSARVKLKVYVLGPGEARSPFLNPRQRSRRTQVLGKLQWVDLRIIYVNIND